MEEKSITNTYEEARKQRLQENRQRFQDLGISSISKGLSDLTDSLKKSQVPKRHISKPKSTDKFLLEPRRSARARNIVSYRDDVGVELPSLRKRSRSFSSSWASYLARPLDEVKTASYEERAQAVRVAEKLQESLQSGNPSFVKSMVRSHVYSCFWLGLPSKFCEDHLSKSVDDMVLEDENGTEYGATYIGKRSGLSGGWRAFALDHKLDDGDALVFELTEPTRFKVYITRVSALSNQEPILNTNDRKGIAAGAKKKTKTETKLDSRLNIEEEFEESNLQELRNTDNKEKPKSDNAAKKRVKSANANKPKKEELAEDKDKFASFKSRKKAAPTKLLRKKRYQ